MRILFSTILVIVCWSLCSVSANPISPFSVPLISEVKITDSTHWAIELDGSFYQIPTSPIFGRLRIASSKTIYTYKCLSDRNIHVITRDSIINIPQSENVVIKAFDTIQILDISWRDTAIYCNRLWSFPVRPIAPGNSLVDFWSEESYNGSNTPPFETTRPSIGSKGNYSTLYQLYLMDQNGNPLPQVYIYRYVYATELGMGSVHGLIFLKKMTFAMTFSDLIALEKAEDTLAFCSDSLIDNYGGPFSSVFKWPTSSSYEWYGAYIDTVVSMNDTIVLSWATAIKQTQPLPALTTVRFSSLCPPGGKITFIIATPSQLVDASIKMTDMSGKSIAVLNIPINARGTHSVSWDGTDNRHKRLPRGTYVCRLSEQGKVIGSQTIRLY